MRKIWDIHGGIHPAENKKQSLGHSIATAPIPPQLIVPLSQHIGAPARPIVAVGDRVLKGQCIGKAGGPVSVPVHAASSGTVSAIEKRPVAHPSGLDDLCIVIDTDGLDTWIERKSCDDYMQLGKEDIIRIIRNAGIAGMGGAAFPTSIKLNTSDKTDIHTLIINGTECEPYITADHALMREYSEQLAEGIAILAKLIQPDDILIGIEDNKMDVVETVKACINKHDFEAIAGKTVNTEVITFPTKYPSGGEKQLIQILTGKQVPSGGLPADLGIICQNMGTAVAIADAVVRDTPLISRITTVTGNAIKKQQNFKVLLGTPVQFLLDHSGYDAKQNNRLIMGGPMMGFALTNTATPVVKATNCILAPTEQELSTPPPAQACIRCGMCAEACPASLLPQQLYWFAQGRELEKLEQHNIMDCIECGACSYVCPSNIPLVQYYRASKADIRQRERDMQSAEYAKTRFEAREARLKRLEEEKIAARKARQAKAAANKQARDGEDPKAATVAAALARVNAKKSAASPAVDDNDPVKRALARRQAQQSAPADPESQLRQTVESAEKRLEKAKARLAEAESNDDDNIAAFKTAVDKTEQKLRDAQAALTAFQGEK